MILHGTQIINEKTNTIHVVDEIEVINNETLVFTQDMKCFPISEIRTVKIENIPLSPSESKTIINFTNSLIQVLRFDLPYAEKEPSHIEKLKNQFLEIWLRITECITSSND